MTCQISIMTRRRPRRLQEMNSSSCFWYRVYRRLRNSAAVWLLERDVHPEFTASSCFTPPPASTATTVHTLVSVETCSHLLYRQCCSSGLMSPVLLFGFSIRFIKIPSKIRSLFKAIHPILIASFGPKMYALHSGLAVVIRGSKR